MLDWQRRRMPLSREEVQGSYKKEARNALSGWDRANIVGNEGQQPQQPDQPDQPKQRSPGQQSYYGWQYEQDHPEGMVQQSPVVPQQAHVAPQSPQYPPAHQPPQPPQPPQPQQAPPAPGHPPQAYQGYGGQPQQLQQPPQYQQF